MVVYGEGSYRCCEHGLVHPSLRPPERLHRREWEPRCPDCAEPMDPVPTREDAPLRPTSVYGITKRDQEELVLVLGRAYGLDTVALRYLNVYGPRQALANPKPYVPVEGVPVSEPVIVEGRAPPWRRRPPPTARSTSPPAGASASWIWPGWWPPPWARTSSRTSPASTGPATIRHCFADVSRARERLGFEATVTLERGLPELAAWVAGQRVPERGDEAVAELRARGLVA